MIECKRLQGTTDIHGNQYAGPGCDCEFCRKPQPVISWLDKNFPYKPCSLPDHNHQLHICAPCRNLNTHRELNLHWYCPERGSIHESNTPYHGATSADRTL